MNTINLFMIIKESEFATFTGLNINNDMYYLTYYFINFLAWFLIYMTLYLIARIIGNLKKKVL